MDIPGIFNSSGNTYSILINSQSVSLPESMAAIEELQDGIVTEESTESTDPTPDAPEAEAPVVSAGTEESSSTETDKDNSNNGSSKNPESKLSMLDQAEQQK